MGCAATKECVLPLDEYLDKKYLTDQLQNSVGPSHLSYHYEGHQWALAIDAATPAASYREDLFRENNISVPVAWNELLDLAKLGKVAAPAISIDLLMNFYTFCIAYGKEPFSNDEEIVDLEIGLQGLETMQEFYSLLDKKMFKCNPIEVAELMVGTNDYWYCPFAYCYSNYSRMGYAKNILRYIKPVSFNGKELRTTIGELALQFRL